MKEFNISSIDRSMLAAIQEKIDNLNKPKGSLGRLEELAMQICLIQQTLEPSLAHPCHLLLGGDHGIEREGVSVSPREITRQQMITSLVVVAASICSVASMASSFASLMLVSTTTFRMLMASLTARLLAAPKTSSMSQP